jgi:hypothetical protein
MEEKQIEEIARALGIKDLVPQIYRDLLQPVTQEVGKNLVTVAKALSVALAPLEASVWGYQKIKDWLSAKLSIRFAKVDPDRIQSPPLIIAGPALLGLSFAAQEADLREMYANLLGTAMDKESPEIAHPSYVHVLQQLSPDEAKILRVLTTYESWQLVCEGTYDPMGAITDREKGIPFQFEALCKKADVKNIDGSYSYLDNMVRLRILGEFNRSDAKFIPEGGNRYGTYEADIENEEYQSVYITEYGERFIEACVA